MVETSTHKETVDTVQTWSMFTVKDAAYIVQGLDMLTQNRLKDNPKFEPVSHSITYDSDKKEFVVVVNFRTTIDQQTIINKWS